MTKFKKRKEELAQQQHGTPQIDNVSAQPNNNNNNTSGQQSSGRSSTSSSVSLVSEKFTKIFRKTKAAKPKSIVSAVLAADNHGKCGWIILV